MRLHRRGRQFGAGICGVTHRPGSRPPIPRTQPGGSWRKPGGSWRKPGGGTQSHETRRREPQVPGEFPPPPHRIRAHRPHRRHPGPNRGREPRRPLSPGQSLAPTSTTWQVRACGRTGGSGVVIYIIFVVHIDALLDRLGGKLQSRSRVHARSEREGGVRCGESRTKKTTTKPRGYASAGKNKTNATCAVVAAAAAAADAADAARAYLLVASLTLSITAVVVPDVSRWQKRRVRWWAVRAGGEGAR